MYKVPYRGVLNPGPVTRDIFATSVRISPMSWTRRVVIAYSLFLAQLCSTFSKWNDIGAYLPLQRRRLADCRFPWVDLAREIYRNATLLKIKLIRSLNTREEKLQSYMRLWDENLKVIVAEFITGLSVYNLLYKQEMRNLQAYGEDMLRKITVNSHESIETLKGSYDAVGAIPTICLYGFIEDGFHVVVVK